MLYCLCLFELPFLLMDLLASGISTSQVPLLLLVSMLHFPSHICSA
uniref:Uncharacterized protein n=1 Tax=Rhizophora mucronata TaxID=61149 RepID=A0A2P2PTM5_RHIMU